MLSSRPGSSPMFLRHILVCLCLLVVCGSAFAISKKDLQNLPPRYREWISKEVNYIITNEETDAFVRLANDSERDNFISRFWEIRNPDPGSPTNRYKDDIYERIAYANQWFGRETGTPGWMTDMGRVYITLGAPKQRSKQLNFANIRPMEIWFYDNTNPALPPYFYVVFYQRETGGDFRLYSPYMDGPEKLVTSYQAQSGRVQAWRLIDHDAGRETARITLSLIPSEPVDMEGATSSLSSDVVLATIKGLANNPWTKRMLEEKRRLLEDVSHRVVLNDEFLHVSTIALRDLKGNTDLHFLLRLKRPEDFALGQDSQGRWYYSSEVSVRVFTPEKKLIFNQQRELSRTLNEEEFHQIKDKLFGYEGILPLVPGKYLIEFVLTNKLKNTAFRSEKEVIIPRLPDTGLRLSDIVPFTKAEAANGTDVQPFQLANLKFTPGVLQDIALVQGQDLTFFYQIWTKPAELKPNSSEKLSVIYNYGRMGFQDTKTLAEEVDKSQFSSAGAMVSGKKISTLDLPPGGYRLSITVTDPTTKEKAFGSMQFRIVTDQGTPASWDVIDPELAGGTQSGTLDYQRAQCYLSQGDAAEGAVWLQSAFQKNPANEEVRARLVDSYFSTQQFNQITTVFARSGVTANTDDQTILRIAESFDKLGQTKKSVEILESAVSLKPKSAPLYLSLAAFYQRVGNPAKASEMEQKGRTLSAQQPGV
jgi:GWxTD domain-containing protein